VEVDVESGRDESSGFIRYVCVRDAHYAAGRSVSDGQGAITVHEGGWAYCASGQTGEAHDWQVIDPQPIQSMRHARSWRVGPPAQGSAGLEKKRRAT
jgi:hypothetical protein